MNGYTAPLWLSILALVYFVFWMVWYLDGKLDRVSRGENPGTLFEKVFGRKRGK